MATVASADELRSPADGIVENQAHLKYRPEIDGLRAVAVLPVVFYHSALGFPGGYIGVDVFFVISGYLITKIIYDLVLDRSFSFVEFYDRRVRRLFPALFVVLLAVTLWAVTHMIWIDVRTFGRSLVAATTYLSNVYFYLGSGYFVAAARTRPLLHTWSLAVEEQFYIVVPFLIFILARFLPRRSHVALIVALSLLSFALCVWLTQAMPNAAFYLLPPRAWELGLGAAIAIWAPPVHRFRWLAEALCAGGIGAILFAAFAFSDSTPFPGWHAAIPTLGTAAILSTSGRSGAVVERMLATAPFTFVGKISYSLYLWHWPVIVAFTYAALSPITPAQSFLAVGISFVLAVLSWRYVERPFRTRQLLETARSLFIAAVLASMVAIGVGAALFFGNGYPARYPPPLLAVVKSGSKAMSRSDCVIRKLAMVTSDHLCVRGAAGKNPTFIFVGDSHGSALSDGVFAAAASRGLAGVQFTAVGALPLPGVTTIPNDIPLKEPLTNAFMPYLWRHPELRTVIVSGFWSYRATGQSFRHQMVQNVDAQYDGSGTAYNPTAFRHGLERLVAPFPDRKFIFLDDTPSGDELSLTAYARASYNGLTPLPGLPRRVADAERATYEPILRQLAAEHRNVVYAPVLGRICDAKLCPLFRAGRPLFRDGDHLTQFGSMQLVPALAVVFDRMSTEAPAFEGPIGPAPHSAREAGITQR